jgi:hypothetical protein
MGTQGNYLILKRKETSNDMAQDGYYQHVQVAFDIAMPTLDLLRQINHQQMTSHSNIDGILIQLFIN